MGHSGGRLPMWHGVIGPQWSGPPQGESIRKNGAGKASLEVKEYSLEIPDPWGVCAPGSNPLVVFPPRAVQDPSEESLHLAPAGPNVKRAPEGIPKKGLPGL